MTDFALARRNMIDGQLRPNRVTNAQLLAAIGELPRERFLPEALRSVAYADDDVPLGNGRYLMEPMVLARLIQTLQPRPRRPRPGGGVRPRLWRGAIGTAREVRRGRRERRRPWPPPPSGRRRNWASPASEQTVGQLEAGRCRVGLPTT